MIRGTQFSFSVITNSDSMPQFISYIQLSPTRTYSSDPFLKMKLLKLPVQIAVVYYIFANRS